MPALTKPDHRGSDMAESELAECVTCGNSFRAKPHKSNKYCGVECYRAAQRSGAYKRPISDSVNLRTCDHCGDEFARTRARKRNGDLSDSSYCSRSCYDAARSLAIADRRKSCARCGEKFDPNNAASKYCSHACRVAHKKPKPKTCVNCGCKFSAIKWHHAMSRFIAVTHSKTCSAECHIAWISNNQARKDKISAAFTGKNHPNWRGGMSQIQDCSKRGYGWQAARRKALKRDNWTCVDCGMPQAESIDKFGRGLDVDHIEPYHNFQSVKLANVLSNLACRCKSCHRKAEAKRTGTQMILPFGKSHRTHRGGASKGERHPKAKLRAADVVNIRRRAEAGEMKSNLAREFGVSQSLIGNICFKKIWRHI